MKWLAIIQLVMEIIALLPLNADEQGVTTQVMATVHSNEEQLKALGLQPQDWEELIPHIIAIIMFFLNRRSNPSIPE